MLTITYPIAGSSLDRWQTLLSRLVIAHQFEHQPERTQPTLAWNGDRVEGEAAIDAYLQTLEAELKQWYECRCDKWEQVEGL